MSAGLRFGRKACAAPVPRPHRFVIPVRGGASFFLLFSLELERGRVKVNERPFHGHFGTAGIDDAISAVVLFEQMVSQCRRRVRSE